MHAAPIEQVTEDFSRHLIRLQTYVASWNDDPDNEGHQIRENAQALFLSVKSAHDDIERYKAYHLADPRNGISNSVKMSAYLCKWITRFKVVELAAPKTQDEDVAEIQDEDVAETQEKHEDVTAILLNGAFALYLCRTLIGAELRTPFYFTDQYGDEFQYDLLYREIGEDGLLHIFQMIFTAVGIRRAGVLEFVDEEVAASVFDNQT